jgi:hypothetical protein
MVDVIATKKIIQDGVTDINHVHRAFATQVVCNKKRFPVQCSQHEISPVSIVVIL